MNKKGLLQKSINGVIWTFLDVVVNKISFFLATIYIARVLGPEVYGLIGMITVFITIGNSLVDSGMSVSLIRAPKIDHLDISSVFLGSLFVSLFVYIVFYFGAPLIAEFYIQPILTNVIRVYCLVFIISAFRVVQSALITRNLEFRKNTILMLPAVMISIFIGVLMALNGYGIWSVVFMYLAQQLVLTIMLWFFSNSKISFRFSYLSFKIHFLFGYKLTISGLLNTACNNFNNIIIGKFFTIQDSGYYERSYSLNQYPTTVFTAIISKVSMPMLAKIQSDKERVSLILLYLLKYSFLIMSFIMLLMFIFARELVIFLLGQDWLSAVPFLQIISLSSIFLPIHMFNVNVLQVYGRSDLFLKAEVIKKIFQVSSILILYQFGIYWLVSSLVFLSFIELFINAYYVEKIIPLGIKKQIASFILPLILFLMLIGIHFFIQPYVSSFLEINKILFLVFISFIYFLLFYFSFRKDYTFVKKYVL